MFPTIFEAGSFRLATYGLMMMIAFIAGIQLAARRAPARGIKPEFVHNISTVILVASLLGARLAYVITHLSEFRGQWLNVINPFQGGQFGIAGLVLLGGVLAAIPSTWYYSRKHGHNIRVVFDLLAPSLALGIAIGRMGCLLNGCCFGHSCDLPWAIQYPEASWLFRLGPVHPTQIYSMIANLAIMGILLKTASRVHFRGQIFALFLILYSPARFIVEFLRDYEPEMILAKLGAWNLTTSQLITTCMFLGGIALYNKWKNDSSSVPSDEASE
jgi:phosphatidylglycerol---prolipoprotein diacylglyceryl transferase